MQSVEHLDSSITVVSGSCEAKALIGRSAKKYVVEYPKSGWNDGVLRYKSNPSGTIASSDGFGFVSSDEDRALILHRAD
tara:strand:- start:202 stop:438 length:237 start_codon:yes stop_codon:yes gene_type:complete